MLTSQEGTIVWGFMLENTLFTKFEEHNHALIESAYKQRKSKQSSHYIHIIDMNLPKPYKAKVYFGVVQNHLRMPGTRYYVTRKVIKPSPPPLMFQPALVSPTSSLDSFPDWPIPQPQWMVPTTYDYPIDNDLDEWLNWFAYYFK